MSKLKEKELRLKEELNDYINKYGMSDKKTINKSQELDKIIVIRMKEINKK